MKRKDRLNKILQEYVDLFSKKHEITFDGSVNDDLLDILFFGDYFMSIEDVVFDIDNDINEPEFYNWYDSTLEFAMKNKDVPTINYKSWCMGARYSMKK